MRNAVKGCLEAKFRELIATRSIVDDLELENSRESWAQWGDSVLRIVHYLFIYL